MKTIIKIVVAIMLITLLVTQLDTTQFIFAVTQVPMWALGSAALLLLANVLITAYRFHVLLGDFGLRVPLLDAVRAHLQSILAGAVLFQMFGQVLSRNLSLKRVGLDTSTALAVTLYERGVAAGVSLLLAIGGVLYALGGLTFYMEVGGAIAVKLLVGLLLAFACAAFAVDVLEKAGKLLRGVSWQSMGRRFMDAFGITLAGQVTVAMAYAVICWNWLPVGIPLEKFVAATFVIMFAASIPISFAGFGVRELGAVYVLGRLGVSPHHAALTAVTIGIISLLLPLLVLWLERLFQRLNKIPRTDNLAVSVAQSVTHFNWQSILGGVLPLLTAVLVFFHIHAQRGTGGEINLNLADAFALMGGGLFLAHFIKKRLWPQWAASSLTYWIAAATAILCISFFIGYSRFGLIPWALNNRLIGWVVLMGYLLSGGYVFIQTHESGRLVLLKALVAAGSAVALIEIVMRWMLLLGWVHPGSGLLGAGGVAEGFAQNRNAFAFQMLVAAASGMALFSQIVSARGRFLLTLSLAVCLTAIVQTYSRSGLIVMPIMVLMAIWLGLITWRRAALLAVLVGVMQLTMQAMQAMPSVSMTLYDSSNTERMESILGGLRIWMDHPLFGGGLGTFIHTWPSMHGHPLVIHNSWVWMLAEMGLAGLVAFAGLMGAMFIFAWNSRNLWEAKLALLLLVCFGLISMAHDMLYQRILWLVLGAILIRSDLGFRKISQG